MSGEKVIPRPLRLEEVAADFARSASREDQLLMACSSIVFHSELDKIFPAAQGAPSVSARFESLQSCCLADTPMSIVAWCVLNRNISPLQLFFRTTAALDVVPEALQGRQPSVKELDDLYKKLFRQWERLETISLGNIKRDIDIYREEAKDEDDDVVEEQGTPLRKLFLSQIFAIDKFLTELEDFPQLNLDDEVVNAQFLEMLQSLTLRSTWMRLRTEAHNEARFLRTHHMAEGDRQHKVLAEHRYFQIQASLDNTEDLYRDEDDDEDKDSDFDPLDYESDESSSEEDDDDEDGDEDGDGNNTTTDQPLDDDEAEELRKRQRKKEERLRKKEEAKERQKREDEELLLIAEQEEREAAEARLAQQRRREKRELRQQKRKEEDWNLARRADQDENNDFDDPDNDVSSNLYKRTRITTANDDEDVAKVGADQDDDDDQGDDDDADDDEDEAMDTSAKAQRTDKKQTATDQRVDGDGEDDDDELKRKKREPVKKRAKRKTEEDEVDYEPTLEEVMEAEEEDENEEDDDSELLSDDEDLADRQPRTTSVYVREENLTIRQIQDDKVDLVPLMLKANPDLSDRAPRLALEELDLGLAKPESLLAWYEIESWFLHAAFVSSALQVYPALVLLICQTFSIDRTLPVNKIVDELSEKSTNRRLNVWHASCICMEFHLASNKSLFIQYSGLGIKSKKEVPEILIKDCMAILGDLIPQASAREQLLKQLVLDRNKDAVVRLNTQARDLLRELFVDRLASVNRVTVDNQVRPHYRVLAADVQRIKELIDASLSRTLLNAVAYTDLNELDAKSDPVDNPILVVRQYLETVSARCLAVFGITINSETDKMEIPQDLVPRMLTLFLTGSEFGGVESDEDEEDEEDDEDGENDKKTGNKPEPVPSAALGIDESTAIIVWNAIWERVGSLPFEESEVSLVGCVIELDGKRLLITAQSSIAGKDYLKGYVLRRVDNGVDTWYPDSSDPFTRTIKAASVAKISQLKKPFVFNETTCLITFPAENDLPALVKYYDPLKNRPAFMTPTVAHVDDEERVEHVESQSLIGNVEHLEFILKKELDRLAVHEEAALYNIYQQLPETLLSDEEAVEVDENSEETQPMQIDNTESKRETLLLAGELKLPETLEYYDSLAHLADFRLRVLYALQNIVQEANQNSTKASGSQTKSMAELVTSIKFFYRPDEGAGTGERIRKLAGNGAKDVLKFFLYTNALERFYTLNPPANPNVAPSLNPQDYATRYAASAGLSTKEEFLVGNGIASYSKTLKDHRDKINAYLESVKKFWPGNVLTFKKLYEHVVPLFLAAERTAKAMSKLPSWLSHQIARERTLLAEWDFYNSLVDFTTATRKRLSRDSDFPQPVKRGRWPGDDAGYYIGIYDESDEDGGLTDQQKAENDTVINRTATAEAIAKDIMKKLRTDLTVKRTELFVAEGLSSQNDEPLWSFISSSARLDELIPKEMRVERVQKTFDEIDLTPPEDFKPALAPEVMRDFRLKKAEENRLRGSGAVLVTRWGDILSQLKGRIDRSLRDLVLTAKLDNLPALEAAVRHYAGIRSMIAERQTVKLASTGKRTTMKIKHVPEVGLAWVVNAYSMAELELDLGAIMGGTTDGFEKNLADITALDNQLALRQLLLAAIAAAESALSEFQEQPKDIEKRNTLIARLGYVASRSSLPLPLNLLLDQLRQAGLPNAAALDVDKTEILLDDAASVLEKDQLLSKEYMTTQIIPSRKKCAKLLLTDLVGFRENNELNRPRMPPADYQQTKANLETDIEKYRQIAEIDVPTATTYHAVVKKGQATLDVYNNREDWTIVALDCERQRSREKTRSAPEWYDSDDFYTDFFTVNTKSDSAKILFRIPLQCKKCEEIRAWHAEGGPSSTKPAPTHAPNDHPTWNFARMAPLLEDPMLVYALLRGIPIAPAASFNSTEEEFQADKNALNEDDNDEGEVVAFEQFMEKRQGIAKYAHHKIRLADYEKHVYEPLLLHLKWPQVMTLDKTTNVYKAGSKADLSYSGVSGLDEELHFLWKLTTPHYLKLGDYRPVIPLGANDKTKIIAQAIVALNYSFWKLPSILRGELRQRFHYFRTYVIELDFKDQIQVLSTMCTILFGASATDFNAEAFKNQTVPWAKLYSLEVQRNFFIEGNSYANALMSTSELLRFFTLQFERMTGLVPVSNNWYDRHIVNKRALVYRDLHSEGSILATHFKPGGLIQDALTDPENQHAVFEMLFSLQLTDPITVPALLEAYSWLCRRESESILNQSSLYMHFRSLVEAQVLVNKNTRIRYNDVCDFVVDILTSQQGRNRVVELAQLVYGQTPISSENPSNLLTAAAYNYDRVNMQPFLTAVSQGPAYEYLSAKNANGQFVVRFNVEWFTLNTSRRVTAKQASWEMIAAGLLGYMLKCGSKTESSGMTMSMGLDQVPFPLLPLPGLRTVTLDKEMANTNARSALFTHSERMSVRCRLVQYLTCHASVSQPQINLPTASRKAEPGVKVVETPMALLLRFLISDFLMCLPGYEFAKDDLGFVGISEVIVPKPKGLLTKDQTVGELVSLVRKSSPAPPTAAVASSSKG